VFNGGGRVDKEHGRGTLQNTATLQVKKYQIVGWKRKVVSAVGSGGMER
jgi:hypothetical protein